MKKIAFKLDTNSNKYFHQLIEILKVFSPFDKLRKRQRQVFAEILYEFHLVRSENEDVKERLVFDYKTKENIATRLNITKGNLYNIYKELRQVELLTKEGINPKFRYGYLQFSEITFKFEEEKKER